MTVSEIIQSSMTLEEAKMAVYRLSYSSGEPTALELNQVFYPQLASLVQTSSPLGVIQKFFQPFDLHAQQREAKILEEYLIN